MWLITVRTRLLEEFIGNNIRSYAILSHTWYQEHLSPFEISRQVTNPLIGVTISISLTVGFQLNHPFSTSWLASFQKRNRSHSTRCFIAKHRVQHQAHGLRCIWKFRSARFRPRFCVDRLRTCGMYRPKNPQRGPPAAEQRPGRLVFSWVFPKRGLCCAREWLGETYYHCL
jgi:hypothetical protein